MKPLAAAFLFLTGAQSAEPAGWFVIADDAGNVLGHATHHAVERPEGRETTDTRELRLSGPEQHPIRITERTVTRTDRTGRITTIDSVSRQGRISSAARIRIDDGSAIISQSGGEPQRIPLPPGVRFDNGEGLIAAWDGTTPLEFLAFNIASAEVERMTIERAPVQRPGGMTLLRKRYAGDQLRGIVRIDLDPQRRIVALIQPMFGRAVTTRPATRAEAERRHPPYRMLNHVMRKSPVRIGPAAAQGHIRYRFGFIDRIAFSPPETPEQRVRSDETGVTLDICATCGPQLATDPASLANARRATAWLQRDHPRIRAIATPVGQMDVPDSRKMALLAARAKRIMTRIDFTGHYSAADALARGAGDCSEDAVILAALGRAAGIPTRVVSGLVYSRERYHGVSNVFMPHSWTLAYTDGAWRSFDMSLDGFDATHIALTIGDGDARSITAAGQLASLLDWRSVVEIRKRALP